jgi:hypothetical protein
MIKCQNTFTSLSRWLLTGVALSFFTFVVGCKKQEQAVGEHTIKGRVYYDCTRVPFAHRELELVHYTSTNLFADMSPVVKTDAFGNFSFTYSSTPDKTSITDEYQIVVASGKEAGKLRMSRIPGRRDVNVGDLYAANKIGIFVKVEVSAHYTSEDTLYFGIGADNYHWIYPVEPVAGLFEFDAGGRIYSSESSFNIHSFSYTLGFESYSRSFQTAAAHKTQVISRVDCDARGVVDTVRVVL